MDVLKKACFVLVLLLVFAGVVGAVSIYSNSDHMTIRGTEGKVYFWLVNTDGNARTAAFSADLGNLNGFFEDAGIVLPERGAKGTWLHLSAPGCFRGVERVIVNAEVCDANGDCDTLQKPLLVAASPAGQCGSYVEGSFYGNVFTPAVTYGDGSHADSGILYSSTFNPTDYGVEVWGSSACPQVNPKESATEYFTVINRGAASSFDLRTISPDSSINSFVSPQQVSLSRGESKEISVGVSPGWVSGGRYDAILQVLRNGIVLAEKGVCVNVADVVESSVRLPKEVSGKQCEDISFQGVVDNTGTAGDSFEIAVPGTAVAQPGFFSVKAGGSGIFSITIPADSLSAGKNDFLVTAKSSANSIVGQANVVVNAASCIPPSIPVEASQSQQQNTVKITVAVANDFGTPLENVSATIEGIPPAWSVESTSVASIPPNATANVTLTLKQTTGEEATAPVLVVASNGREVSRKPLQPITAGGGVTGLFTALSQNTVLIGLLILVALLVVILTGRSQAQQAASASASASASQRDFQDSFKKRLAQIRKTAAD